MATIIRSYHLSSTKLHIASFIKNTFRHFLKFSTKIIKMPAIFFHFITIESNYYHFCIYYAGFDYFIINLAKKNANDFIAINR